MDYRTIVEEISPCGLDCSRCVYYADGKIRSASTDLKTMLTGFEKMARNFSNIEPRLAQYDGFEKVLSFFTEASCKGCRQGSRCIPGCAAHDCVREKNIDFCFECDEFPCTKNTFQPMLEAKWKSNNQAMKESGVEAFYNDGKKKQRY
ncbi:MAG TPA: DUF3795 domain-containing protein [Spirochaetota bacterium]